MTEDAGANAIVGAYIAEALAEERARKASLEARGLALITTSGAFTTLVLGIGALVAPEELPVAARAFLVVGLLCFLVAAAKGALVNKPEDYTEPDAEKLGGVLDELRAKSAASGERTVARSRLVIIEAARTRNKGKASALLRGSWAQVIGMVSIAGAALTVLVG